MRVGFDGHTLSSPAGGVRRYAGALLDALVHLNPADSIIVFGAPDDAKLPEGVRRRPVPHLAPTNLGRSLVDLPRTINRELLDVFHAPAYTAPLGAIHPLALTVHDVSYERHPEWYPYRRDPVRRWFYRKSAKAADMIITDSEFSRQEIAKAYDIDPDQIAVVPLGVGTPFADAVTTADAAGALPEPYVLHVGDLHARRNLGTLVRALARLPSIRATHAVPTLILVGSDRGSRAGIEREAAAGHVPVQYLESLEDRRLASLYSRASVFAYPSRYEGFGLPLVEAMACGAPVVAARAGSIPEVVGTAGLLFDPDDEVAMAHALAGLLDDPGQSNELREAGRRRAHEFTWERTARLTSEAYRKAADRHPRRGRAQ